MSASPRRTPRVNFVGELGWELHHPIEMQNTIFDLIMNAGSAVGICLFGIKAMDLLRLEKSYRLIPRELSIEYSALESGSTASFIRTRASSSAAMPCALARARLCQPFRHVSEVHGTTDVDARGSEPIHDKRGALVGRCTSGGYGWRLGKSLALAMVRPDLGEIGSEVTVRILVTLSRHSHSRPPFDPENLRLRA